jgi:cob(I)alamin adenosyltransferase
VNPPALTFLNRLSDFLFVLARRENLLAGIKENTWTPKKPGA